MLNYQQEFLCSVKEDIAPLLHAHWEEVALNKDKIPLNPDWDRYQQLEDLGKLVIFTARRRGELVGYFVVIIDTHLHYKDHLFASNDVIYLKPELRKSGLGKGLISFAEGCLKEDGVSVLCINTKFHKPFDYLLNHLEFQPSDKVYFKYIGN